MGIRKKWLIALIVMAVIYIAIQIFSLSMSSNSDILKPSPIKTGLQNFTIEYDGSANNILVGTYKNKVIAFDPDGTRKWEFDTMGSIRAIKVDEKGRKAYVGSEDRVLYILDADTGKLLNSINVKRRIYSIDINPDASLIAVSAGINVFKHDLLLYDTDGMELFAKPIGSTSKKVVFSADGESVLLGTDRADIIMFDLKGNELKRVRLDTEIIGLAISKETGEVAAYTKHSVYFHLDKNLMILKESPLISEGMGMGASGNLDWIGAGTLEGDMFILDRNGVIQYQYRFDQQVTAVVFTDKKTYVTGLGDFVYELDTGKLQNIKALGRFGNYLKILVYLLPVVILFLLFMTFNRLRRAGKLFFKALYKHRTAYLLLLPTFFLLLLFCYYPIIIAMVRSFTDWNMNQFSTREIKFIGLDNFRKMFEEGYFLTGVNNLIILLVTGFIKVMTIPLLVAELVFAMRSARQKYWFRFLFVLPMVVPGIVGALLWQNIYDPNVGLVNQFLRGIGLDTMTRVWLGDPATAIWAIVFMGFPFINAFAFLVYYGGLINIPFSLFEAAKMDGSNSWWNFIRIHLPLITSQMKMLIILTFIGTVQDYGAILVTTAGGPGTATYVPGLELYYNATKFGKYGYACSLGLVMFVVILMGTILNMKIKAETDYNN